MNKFLIGLLAGLAGGGVGVALLHPAGSGAGDGHAESAHVADDAQSRLDAMEAERDRLLDEQDRMRKQASADLVAADKRIGDSAREADELRHENEELKAKLAQASRRSGAGLDAMDIEGRPMPAISEAEARQRGRALTERVEAAIVAGDKQDILAAMREFEQLGPGAYREFFDAYLKIRNLGNPFHGVNELGLSMPEFMSLMPAAYRDIALANLLGDIPDGARSAAVYDVAWDKKLSSDDKAKILGKVLESTSDTDLANTTIRNMGWLGSPAAAPYLSKTATSSAIAPEVRVSAIRALSQMAAASDWTAIEQLQNDPNPKVAEAALQALFLRNPSATGYLVTSVTADSPAARAGIAVGDIIVRYNGETIGSDHALMVARSNASKDGPAEVQVEVSREGAVLAIRIGTGQLGVEGAFVKRSAE